jgi:hypothetical protein
MAVLGAFLAALGVADAFRDTHPHGVSPARRYTALAAGLVTLVALLAAGGVSPTTGLSLGIPLALLLAVWILLDVITRAVGETVARSAAFLAVGAGIAVALFFADDSSAAWPAWAPGPLSAFSPSQVVFVTGIALAQVTTANVLVRLILDAVKVPTKAGTDRLRSGRVLGPMERLFIVGLGLAGNLTAAAVVVGAKGLLRFPELAASESSTRAAASPIIIQSSMGEPGKGADTSPSVPAHQGPNPVTEYFLIGSFASWLLALAGLALARLVLG